LNGQGVGGVWFIVAPGTQFGATPTAGTPTAVEMGTPAAAGEVTVTLMDGNVDSSVVTFQVGQEYTFNITNSGSNVHAFYIEKAGANHEPLEANGEEAEVEDIQPGASASLTWTFTEPGNYQLACHVPGHYPAGMALNVKVTG
jgi:uncharacterized cupredoxin-like copper-binding protein